MFDWVKDHTRPDTEVDLASALYKVLDNRFSKHRKSSIEMSGPEARAYFRYDTQKLRKQHVFYQTK